MTAIQTAAVAPLKVYIAGKITGAPSTSASFFPRTWSRRTRDT